jgi:hypothetical protein
LPDYVDGLAGSDDLKLRQEREEVHHYAITLEPLAATIRPPALSAGKRIGNFNVGTE